MSSITLDVYLMSDMKEWWMFQGKGELYEIEIKIVDRKIYLYC
jgi:hypothetical protein